MTIALPQLAGQDLTTHSQRSCYKTCQRRAFYAYELGVRRRRSSTPQRLGSAVHLGLDLFGQGVERDAAILRAIAGYTPAPAWVRDTFAWEVERETVAVLLAGYHWRWGGTPPGEVLATEQAYRLPLLAPFGDKSDQDRAGKIDKIVKLPDVRVAVREHKTTGESIAPRADYWTRLEIDEQISEYVLAARELGYPAATVEYDVIRKPAIKPKKLTKKDVAAWLDGGLYHGQPTGAVHVGQLETARQFGARLLADIVKRPDFYYHRREIPRLDADLEEYRRDLWAVQQQYAESRRLGRWPRNTAACVGRYGPCEYLHVCRVGIDPERVPQGFEQLKDVHPELQEAA